MNGEENVGRKKEEMRGHVFFINIPQLPFDSLSMKDIQTDTETGGQTPNSPPLSLSYSSTHKSPSLSLPTYLSFRQNISVQFSLSSHELPLTPSFSVQLPCPSPLSLSLSLLPVPAESEVGGERQ